MERWTILLAEHDGEPGEAFLSRFQGIRRLVGRTWLWEGWLPPEEERKAFLFGETPLYGKVYARVIAKGETLEDFKSHPLYEEVREKLKRTYYTHLVQGQLAKAMEVLEKARRLGLSEELAQLEERARKIQTMRAYLLAGAVPFSVTDDGRIGIGSPPAFYITEPEEAERVSKVYSWARRYGLRVQPAPGTSRYPIRFYVDLLAAERNGNKVEIPVAGNGQGKVYALRRRGKALEAEPVPVRVPEGVGLVAFSSSKRARARPWVRLLRVSSWLALPQVKTGRSRA